MENLQMNKFIKIFGRIIFWVFLISGLCRIFLRDYYSRENHNSVITGLLVLAVLHLILKIIYEKESVIGSFNLVMIQLKKRLPELLVIVLMFALWYFYKRKGY